MSLKYPFELWTLNIRKSVTEKSIKENWVLKIENITLQLKLYFISKINVYKIHGISKAKFNWCFKDAF